MRGAIARRLALVARRCRGRTVGSVGIPILARARRRWSCSSSASSRPPRSACRSRSRSSSRRSPICIGIGGIGLIILPIKILGGVDSFVLLAIPLFILGGALMESAGISQRIVDLAMAIVGRIRGGLAMVVVVAEVIFSGISGSTAADVSAISSLLVPSMKKAGYSGPESVSIVAAASAMGILVPPCLTMVVLGSLVNLSIVTLFLAGFLPAFLLAAVAPRPDCDPRTAATVADRRAVVAGRPRPARSGGRSSRSACRCCSSAASSPARRRSPRRRCSPSSTRSSSSSGRARCVRAKRSTGSRRAAS